ncbi:sodium-independent anion transporter [Francisella salina]|uniref:sodium-independent anion transporter n=1 Tax=Francisella salina TaxID=573569 RepID=UPI00030FAF22
MFFSSTTGFRGLFKFDKDPQEVIIDFKYSRVADQSAIDTIQWVADEYTKLGKNLHLRHLNKECKTLLGKAGDLVELNILEDKDYHIATDRLA